jgi:hypothetical protein
MFQVEVWPTEALSFCLHGLRYPQHLMMRSAGTSRWYPGSRCGSRGGLKRTGQHFARGEQAAAMPPDTVHGGAGTVRVEVTDGSPRPGEHGSRAGSGFILLPTRPRTAHN